MLLCPAENSTPGNKRNEPARIPSAAYGSPTAIGSGRCGTAPSGKVLGGGAPGGGVLDGVSIWMGGGTGKVAPGREAAFRGCTSGGGLLIGSGSKGGGKVAPGRDAALTG